MWQCKAMYKMFLLQKLINHSSIVLYVYISNETLRLITTHYFLIENTNVCTRMGKMFFYKN